jgi:hypothetical protein
MSQGWGNQKGCVALTVKRAGAKLYNDIDLFGIASHEKQRSSFEMDVSVQWATVQSGDTVQVGYRVGGGASYLQLLMLDVLASGLIGACVDYQTHHVSHK